MIQETRTVKKTADSVEYEFNVSCPETLEEAISLYGLTERDIVGAAFDNLVIKLQAYLRTQLKTGKPAENLQVMVDNWKPESGRTTTKTILINQVVALGLLPKNIANTLSGIQLKALIDSYNNSRQVTVV